MTSTDLLKGLTTKSAETQDTSRKLPGHNMGQDATRSGTAPTPKTLGPRTA